MTQKEYPNPEETLKALKRWRESKEELDELNQRIEATIPPEMLEQRTMLEAGLAKLRETCKEAAQTFGDYKDKDGWECRIEKRVSIEYLPGPFRQAFPQFADACIEETVNKNKVKGLLKGGLINDLALEVAASRTTVEAFILR